MENKKGNAHKNHRQRLKTKVKDFGLECLAYHEILELLLTYSIPRKDTNPIAHKLIENFGSFANVIDADYYDLLKVEGIGPESALFITMLNSFMEIYNKSKLESKIQILNNTGKCVKFFRDNYRIKLNEYMVVACLSKNKRVRKTLVYKGFDDTQVTLDLRNIANKINDHGINSVVLYHTHPGGGVEPSDADIQTTQRIVNVCLMHGIDVDDHIIFNEADHFSFKGHHYMDKMKDSYHTMFAPLSNEYLEYIRKQPVE